MKKLKVLLCSMLISSTVFATPTMAAENTFQNEGMSTRATTYYASGMVESGASCYAHDVVYCSGSAYGATLRLDFSVPLGETITFQMKNPLGQYQIFPTKLDHITCRNGETITFTMTKCFTGYYELYMISTSPQTSRVTVNIYK